MNPRSTLALYGTALLVVILALCALILFGCRKPAPASVAMAPPVAALPTCPDGYMAVSSHEATRGAEAGHGFVMVRYLVNGKQMHLFCTASTNVADPRRNQPVSGAIPDPASTKPAKDGGNQ